MTKRDELAALYTPDLYLRAVHLAMRRMDIGFLWELLRDLPAEAPSDGPGRPADVTRALGCLHTDDP